MAKLFWFFISFIGYVYAGYPALLALLAKSKPRKLLHGVGTPTVTLLIAAYNEESTIAQKLENSLSLDYPRDKLQILVAADGSTDQTPDIVRQYADQGVDLNFSPPRKGKMAAINRAMDRVTGQIVVFSDANNLYAPDTLRKLLPPFADPQVGATTGAKVILKGDGALGDSEGLYWKYESFIKTQETRLGTCTGAAGEIFAIRKSLYQSPPDDIINDDFYLAMALIRRGYNVAYVPQAKSTERVSISAEDEVTRRARIVAGRYQAMGQSAHLLPANRPLVVWQVVSHKFLRPLVPLAMIGALLTNIAAVRLDSHSKNPSLLKLTHPFNVLLLAFQVDFYALAWIGNKLKPGGTVGKLLYLPTFLVNSNWAALVGLYRYLTGRQTSLWQRAQRREMK